MLLVKQAEKETSASFSQDYPDYTSNFPPLTMT